MSKYKALTSRQLQRVITHLIACEDILENRCAQLEGDLESKEMTENNKYACIDANATVNNIHADISTLRTKLQQEAK